MRAVPAAAGTARISAIETFAGAWVIAASPVLTASVPRVLIRECRVRGRAGTLAQPVGKHAQIDGGEIGDGVHARRKEKAFSAGSPTQASGETAGKKVLRGPGNLVVAKAASGR